MRLLLLLAAGLLGVPLMAETATPAPAQDSDADANKWTLRLYRFPVSSLAAPGDENPLPTPSLPSAEAGRTEVERFLHHSNEAVRHYFEQGGAEPLPDGFLAVFDPVSQSLAVRAPKVTQAKIAYTMEQMAKRVLPCNLVFNVHVVEGEGALMRSLMKEAVRSASHQGLWERVSGLVEQGSAREVGTLHLDTRSGQRASTSVGNNRTYATGFHLAANGWLETTHEERYVGTTIEVDPVLGPDATTIDLTFDLQHDFAPPLERWVHAVPVGSQRIDSQLVDFRSAHISTGSTTWDGAAKLLGVWVPETATEPERAGHLQAAFLTADVARLLPPSDTRVLKLLETYGEKLLPTPAAMAPPPAAAVPKGMQVRRFHVPMDFLDLNNPDPPADPFARPQAQPLVRGPGSAVNILKGAGIAFPEGATAMFSPMTSEIIVQNLPENLELVEAFVAPIGTCRSPTTLAFSIHVVQADAKILRDFAARNRQNADQTPDFRALEDAATQGKAKFLSSAWLETRSGQRARLTAGTQYLTVSPPELGAAPSPPPGKPPVEVEAANANANAEPKKESPAPEAAPAKKAPPAEGAATFTAKHEATNVGFNLEVDPVIGPDGNTIDLSLAFDYHYAPPSPHEGKTPSDERVLQAAIPATDFHIGRVLTATTMSSGTTRLFGIWKPEGPGFQNGEVLQAMFLRVDVLREPDTQLRR